MFTSINGDWFPFLLNNKCKYSTTKMISVEVIFNCKNNEMINKINYKYIEV